MFTKFYFIKKFEVKGSIFFHKKWNYVQVNQVHIGLEPKRFSCLIFIALYFSFKTMQLRQLEEINGCNRSSKSSCASTPTSGSDGHVSSMDFSPKSLEKHCRPIENVIMETEIKGTMIERLNQVEDRMLKVFIINCLTYMQVMLMLTYLNYFHLNFLYLFTLLIFYLNFYLFCTLISFSFGGICI